ncbi:MAG: acetoacetate--CoA ligase, partial [Niabella sp.]
MSEPKLLWKPSEFFIKNSNLTQYQNWLSREQGLSFSNYESLWQWSVSQPALFWQSIMNYFKVRCHEQPVELMSDAPMPYTKWFTGATLNYAEHIFRQKTNTRPAIYFASERTRLTSVSWEELENKTASLQQFFQHIGVKQGDRIAAYLPNIPQASIAMLATVAIGAVWSSCSPDFGTESVLDRFKQIEPKVLIAVDGYCYNGKPHNRLDIVKEISAQLPSVEKLILIPYLNSGIEDVSIDKAILWDDIMSLYHGELSFTPIPFSHPIWILYSSGTTGIPKAITHSHGGMLLEHLKYLSFHNDVHVGENFFWYSTTGWMMWNFVHAALLVGASIVLYDGAASYPDMTALWNLTAQIPIQHFGTSAPFIMACMKAGLKPGQQFNLTALRSIGSTGSPLPPEGFDYVYENIKQEVWLCSM